MRLYDVAITLGLVTYSSISLSVLSGTRKINLGFRWHRRIGFIGITAASIHGLIVLYSRFFV
jgi:hypothetical protein